MSLKHKSAAYLNLLDLSLDVKTELQTRAEATNLAALQGLLNTAICGISPTARNSLRQFGAVGANGVILYQLR